MSKVTHTTILTDDGAAANVAIKVEGQKFVGQGIAKRHPKDERDDFIGAALATARALRDAADQLEARAEQAMDNAPMRKITQVLYTHLLDSYKQSSTIFPIYTGE